MNEREKKAAASIPASALHPVSLPLWLSRVDDACLVVCADAPRALQVARDLEVLRGASEGWEVVCLTGYSGTPYDGVCNDPEITWSRNAARHCLTTSQKGQTLICDAATLLSRWCPSKVFIDASMVLRIGDEPGRARLLAALGTAGYSRADAAIEPGLFAVRGSLVDFFPGSSPSGFRVDFFGDEIDAIWRFDPCSQRRQERVDVASVYPIREVVFTAGTKKRAVQQLRELASDQCYPSRRLRSTIQAIDDEVEFFGIEATWPAFYGHAEPVLETLTAQDRLVVFDNVELIDSRFTDIFEAFSSGFNDAVHHHDLALPPPSHIISSEELKSWRSRTALRTPDLPPLSSWETLGRSIQLILDGTNLGEPLDPLADELMLLGQRDFRTVISCDGELARDGILELLRARGVSVDSGADLRPSDAFAEMVTRVISTPISRGFLDVVSKTAFILAADILPNVPSSPRLAKKRRSDPDLLRQVSALGEGDWVVHVDHGFGRFLHLQRMVHDGISGDFAVVEYAGGDKLYVPVARIDALQVYRGTGKGLRADKLGGQRWQNAKKKVADSVLELAHRLLEIQAQRQSLPGICFAAPCDIYREFARAFPHTETTDQLAAIDDVIADLTTTAPMDRLICGDVGFGKTEVAMRGAFLAALSGYQVAILVPTTVLAEQHGVTFRERFGRFAVRVEVLSRFRSKNESKEIIAGLLSGAVDIVIGTHRMLTADVGFKQLGLLVVDEEQRFGVKHKESLKRLGQLVNVLTMSATPIPRTLNMALGGLRDLSLIATPPARRVPIETTVSRFDEVVVRQAIENELKRGGQVFVVHNRVGSIGAFARLVKRLVPGARVVVGHGQMKGAAIERVMAGFAARQSDVLVCTAIIESGLDIPRANTMIVNRADMFGLGQLHQLRGRVGRGSERGFAYLMVPRSSAISGQAAERLEALRRFSALGSGYDLANRDLDIRGGGNLLGSDQSGSIAAVGFQLYSELLARAVEQAAEGTSNEGIDPEVHLSASALLPDDYIEQPIVRLQYYQRLAHCRDDEELRQVFQEVEDLFGAAPIEARALFEEMLLRNRLRSLGAVELRGSIIDSTLRLSIAFSHPAPRTSILDHNGLLRLVAGKSDIYKIYDSGKLGILVDLNDGEQPPDDIFRRARVEVERLPTYGPSNR